MFFGAESDDQQACLRMLSTSAYMICCDSAWTLNWKWFPALTSSWSSPTRSKAWVRPKHSDLCCVLYVFLGVFCWSTLEFLYKCEWGASKLWLKRPISIQCSLWLTILIGTFPSGYSNMIPCFRPQPPPSFQCYTLLLNVKHWKLGGAWGRG